MQDIAKKMRIFGFHKGIIEILIATNILIFILTLINPQFVFDILALQPISIFVKPWTLITNMFVHAGFGHIGFNMLALFFFGLYLERLVGEREFIKVYFIGGIIASLVYVFTSLLLGMPDPRTYAVGASGALFAVMGMLVVLRPNLQVIVFPIMFPMPLWVAVLVGVLVFSFMPNIAWQAHLGGLIVGLLFGRYFKKQQMPKEPYAYGGYGYRFY